MELRRASNLIKTRLKIVEVGHSRQTRVYPGSMRQKYVQCVLGQWQGTWGAPLTQLKVCTCVWRNTKYAPATPGIDCFSFFLSSENVLVSTAVVVKICIHGERVTYFLCGFL